MRPSRLTPYVLLLTWLYVAAVLYLSLAPLPAGIPLFPYVDKLEHFLAYALMMALFAWVYIKPRWRLAHAVFCLGLGVIIEFMQKAGGLREFELGDMLANALGVGLCLLIWPWAEARFKFLRV